MSGAGGEGPRTVAGAVAPGLERELPGLGLRWFVAERGAGPSPPDVKRRLRALASRIRGAQAVALRNQPIPWAYRVFFRQIGLDPDIERTPAERVVLRRIEHGGFRSEGLPQDALTIAIAESGVALRAFDADAVAGAIRIRPSDPGETLGGRRVELPAGTLVIADEVRPLALLFGQAAAGVEVGRSSARTLVCAISVQNVPQIAVEEALWIAAEALRA